MTVQDSVLQILANEGNDVVSGEDISSRLGVSRAAVWKAIQKLQEFGFDILGTRNKGYMLKGTHDPITEYGIRDQLSLESRDAIHLVVKKTTGSTNNDLRALAENNAAPYTALVCGEQSSGKGRRGRQFFSLGDVGVYLSILLKPNEGIQDAGLLTGAAAVAVCRAIIKVFGVEPSIKWVNDIYIGTKKVCGILTEGVADLETGCLDYAILGIGLNVYEPLGGFPEEIKHRAGVILQETTPNSRNKLAAEIINQCYEIYSHEKLSDVIKEYQSFSLMKDREVEVIKPTGERHSAMSRGVNDDLSLSVEYSDGTTENLQSGEVSIAL